MGNAQAVVAGRNYLVYSTPWDVDNELPANTIDYGVAWGTPGDQLFPWIDMGYTIGGLQLTMNVERTEIRVDQEFDPIVRPVTSRSIQLTTEFAEMTVENLQLASGLGTITQVAPGVGTRGQDELAVDSSVQDTYNSWGYDILQPDGEAFRVAVWKGLPTGSPSPSFTPENAATIALQVSALVDTSTSPSRVMVIRDVVPALAA